MIFDTHAHYTDARFDEDREELLAGMKARGVGEIVEVGASIQSTKDADIERLTPEDMQWLADLTHRDKVVAIGEIGLDYYYDEPGRDLQKKWFARQLQVAAETQMPVIIHSRDAAKDTLDIMNEHCAWQNGGVIHCFSYSPEIAKIYLDKGFYLGIGGVVTFKNSKTLIEGCTVLVNKAGHCTLIEGCTVLVNKAEHCISIERRGYWDGNIRNTTKYNRHIKEI